MVLTFRLPSVQCDTLHPRQKSYQFYAKTQREA